MEKDRTVLSYPVLPESGGSDSQIHRVLLPQILDLLSLTRQAQAQAHASLPLTDPSFYYQVAWNPKTAHIGLHSFVNLSLKPKCLFKAISSFATVKNSTVEQGFSSSTCGWIRHLLLVHHLYSGLRSFCSDTLGHIILSWPTKMTVIFS